MTASLGLLAAFALDVAFGEPPSTIHPVAWMGRAIARGKTWALATKDRVDQLGRGAVVALFVPAVSAALAFAAMRAAEASPALSIALTALLLKPMFALRALRDAAFVVRNAVAKGDLSAARRGLASLCSRDAAALDDEALVAATIESVAENTSDSVVAPLFYFALFGVPGAAFYRAANTIDAMMGYHGKLEYAGKAGARLDDLLNLVPARITAALLVLAGAVTGGEVRRGLAMWRRDAARTESPNAGRPMATMAGLLGVRLAKEGHYALGDARRPLTTERITRAWRIASGACLLAVGIAAYVAEVIRD
jgi:adenosylcobinamide-phosphate synthase